jgi:ATP-dependent exoDNAse (exonuclease V) beta subunit
MIGTLVHRMLERFGFAASDASITDEQVTQLIRPSELIGETAAWTASGLVTAARESYRMLARRADVESVYCSGQRWHEVPFVMRLEGRALRGTIDCLVHTGRSIAVLEFKTGRRRPEHAAQVDLYRKAAVQLFPGMTVEAYLVYPAEHAAV